MYVQKIFAENNVETLHDTIRNYSLGTIIILTDEGIEANHIPFAIKEQPAPYGTLQGHVSRANPLWHQYQEESETLIIFHGPNTYISPNSYYNIEKYNKVAPSWNYVVVHAYGRLKIIEDNDWLYSHLVDLTDAKEQERSNPWHVSDTPAEFTKKLVNNIVGIEMKIMKLIGKSQLSQHRKLHDRESLVEKLSKENNPSSREIAKLVKETLEPVAD